MYGYSDVKELKRLLKDEIKDLWRCFFDNSIEKKRSLEVFEYFKSNLKKDIKSS